MIRVVNMRNERVKGVKIDRSSVLGNKFKVSKYGRKECILMYRDWLFKLDMNGKVWKEINRLVDLYLEEGELNLLCWCGEGRCHGDVLKEVILLRSKLKKKKVI